MVLLLSLGAVTAQAGADPPGNDALPGAAIVPAVPFQASFDISTATTDGDDAAVDQRCGSEPATHSVWFSYTPAYDSRLGGYARAATLARDMTVDVITGSSGSLDPVTCSVDLYDGAPLEAGTRYLIRVALADPALQDGTVGQLHLMDVACDGLTSGDLDGDACPDLAVGLPGASTGGVARTGAVEVAYGNDYNSFDKRRQQLVPGSALGVEPQPGAGFGATLAQGRLDGDAFEDLVVGIPRLDVGAAVDAGAVLVLFGGPDGVGARRLLLAQGGLPGSGSHESGDRFGSALAVGGHALAVGVPGEDVGSDADAGAVVTFRGFAPNGSPTARLLTQAGPVAGAAEAGDRFGAAVVLHPSGTLFVGVPGEDVGAVADAGALVAVAPSGASTAFSQNTSGMGGVAETGDGFGAAITFLPEADYSGYRVAVGAPGEDVAGVRDAGAVGFLGGLSQTASARPLAMVVTQDTAGVPGVAERGDRFGSVLSSWRDFHQVNLVVGVPDEDVGSLTSAGAAFAVALTPLELGSAKVSGRVLTQASPHVVGTPEAGDRLGASLTATGADPEYEDDGSDSLYVGAPGEDLAGVTDAGFVQGMAVRFTTIAPQTRQSGQLFGASLNVLS